MGVEETLCMRLGSLLVLVAIFTSCVLAGPPRGWKKISGEQRLWSGEPDGLDVNTDRENSEATTGVLFDGYLYLGISRDSFHRPGRNYDTIYGNLAMLAGLEDIDETHLLALPEVNDLKARVYRFHLENKSWELFWISPMCEHVDSINLRHAFHYSITSMVVGKDDVLYFGTEAGDATLCTPNEYFPGASIFAVLPGAAKSEATRVFSRTNARKIQAITNHGSSLFWATDDDEAKCRLLFSSTPCKFPNSKVALYSSMKPYKKYLTKRYPDEGNSVNPETPGYFQKREMPSYFKNLKGEVSSLISAFGRLYLFFTSYDFDNGGFWLLRMGVPPQDVVGSAKISDKALFGSYDSWTLLVGDRSLGARYPPGMGAKYGGSAGIATPYLFHSRIYVGVSSDFLLRMQVAETPGIWVCPCSLLPSGVSTSKRDGRCMSARLSTRLPTTASKAPIGSSEPVAWALASIRSPTSASPASASSAADCSSPL